MDRGEVEPSPGSLVGSRRDPSPHGHYTFDVIVVPIYVQKGLPKQVSGRFQKVRPVMLSFPPSAPGRWDVCLRNRTCNTWHNDTAHAQCAPPIAGTPVPGPALMHDAGRHACLPNKHSPTWLRLPFHRPIRPSPPFFIISINNQPSNRPRPADHSLLPISRHNSTILISPSFNRHFHQLDRV